MNGDHETDLDLAARFARLREEEAARGADYARLSAAARLRGRPRRRRAVPVLLAAGAMIVLALLVLRGPGSPRPAARGFDLSATSLPMPTDFLLDTPGSELLRSVPALGTPDAGFPGDPLPTEKQS